MGDALEGNGVLDRVRKLERAVLGGVNDDGQWIEGIFSLLQSNAAASTAAVADVRRELGQMRLDLAQGSANQARIQKIGLGFLALASFSVFGNLLHNYNILEAIGHLAKGFFG